jgi:hypothetical protein
LFELFQAIYDAGFRIFRTTLQEQAEKVAKGEYIVPRTVTYRVSLLNINKPQTRLLKDKVKTTGI